MEKFVAIELNIIMSFDIEQNCIECLPVTVDTASIAAKRITFINMLKNICDAAMTDGETVTYDLYDSVLCQCRDGA